MDTAVGFVAQIALLALFVAYWLPPVGRIGSLIAVVIFLSAVARSMSWIPRYLDEVDCAGATLEQNHRYKLFVASGSLIFNTPSYWFGGIAAFRAL